MTGLTSASSKASVSNKPIYLDHAAATPLDSEVLARMQPYLTTHFYNPSATYLAAKEVRTAIDEARARVAKTLGVRPGEIIFTAGATEANNLAIHGVMAKYPGKKLLVSAAEHASVLETAKHYNHAIIPVTSQGLVDPQTLQTLITDDVVLISAMLINNEIGTIQSLASLSAVVQEQRHHRQAEGNPLPLILHSDAAQAPNVLAVQPKKLGVDLLSLNGGKIYGPKQSGVLFVAAGIQLEPLVRGGGQEYGLRSGTENVANIVGFSYALQKAAQLRPIEEKRYQNLRSLFIKLLAEKVPSAQLTIAGNAPVAHNFIHLIIPGADNERLMMELDEAGIQCAVGSACSASSEEPSHVLSAIGLTDQQAQSSLRFTMGRSTTEADVKKTVVTLAKLV